MKYRFYMTWMMSGMGEIKLPENIKTIEEAKKYAIDHQAEIAIPDNGDYIIDSDILDFEDSDGELVED